MNKWWLKIFSIALLTIFSETFTMEEGDDYEAKNQLSLSNLPLELKHQIIVPLVSEYIDQNLNLNDVEDLEENLGKLVKEFPKYAQENICGNLVNKELYSITCKAELDKYFKWFLLRKLCTLDMNEKENLLRTIKMDKQCSSLMVILLFLSHLNISSSSFKRIYSLIKEAISIRAIYICRALNEVDYHCFFHSDFHYFNILNVDPIKFKDTELLEFFLHPNLDMYHIIFNVRSDLKQKLLSIASNHQMFKEAYLNTDLARAIYSQDLEEVKKFLTSSEVKVNAPCSIKGFTPLMLATIFEAKSIVEYLLNEGANYLTKNKFRKNALHYAAASHNLDLLKIFFNKLDDAKEFLEDALECAIFTQNFELFDYACQSIESIKGTHCESTLDLKNIIDHALTYASVKNRVRMFKRLLKLNLHEKLDKFLSIAIENNSFEMAMFLNSKISIFWGYSSPLPYQIARAGDLPKMKLLISLGVNVGLKNGSEKTPCDIARGLGYEELVALLEDWHKKNDQRQIENDTFSQTWCVIS